MTREATVAQALPTIYARRGYGYDTATQGFTRKLTFVSWDEADKDSAGYQVGWFEDGEVIDRQPGRYRLRHVYTPSWRCGEPQALIERAA